VQWQPALGIIMDIYHSDPWPVAATTVYELLMMDAVNVRNM
jgi:hypothetical protein